MSKRYIVKIDDNYHYMCEEDRLSDESYDNLKEAINITELCTRLNVPIGSKGGFSSALKRDYGIRVYKDKSTGRFGELYVCSKKVSIRKNLGKTLEKVKKNKYMINCKSLWNSWLGKKITYLMKENPQLTSREAMIMANTFKNEYWGEKGEDNKKIKFNWDLIGKKWNYNVNILRPMMYQLVRNGKLKYNEVSTYFVDSEWEDFKFLIIKHSQGILTDLKVDGNIKLSNNSLSYEA